MKRVYMMILGAGLSLLAVILVIWGCGKIQGPLEKSAMKAPHLEPQEPKAIIFPSWAYDPEDYRLTITDAEAIIIGTVKSATDLKLKLEIYAPEPGVGPWERINVYQDSLIEVEEVLKAGEGISVPKEVLVRSFGGKVGKYTLTVAGCEHAPFVKGEKVLLFLTPVPKEGHWIITNARYGRFRITKDGRLIRPGWVGTDGEPFPEKEFDLSQFKALIKEVTESNIKAWWK